MSLSSGAGSEEDSASFALLGVRRGHEGRGEDEARRAEGGEEAGGEVEGLEEGAGVRAFEVGGGLGRETEAGVIGGGADDDDGGEFEFADDFQAAADEGGADAFALTVGADGHGGDTGELGGGSFG